MRNISTKKLTDKPLPLTRSPADKKSDTQYVSNTTKVNSCCSIIRNLIG